MCASYESKFAVRQAVQAFEAAGTPFAFPDGVPNLEPRDEVRPTDTDRVAAVLEGETRLHPMRFGFPPPRPKAAPIINFRAEGRRFSNGATSGRALVLVSGFYEFTGDRYPKTRWVLRAAPRGGDPAPLMALAALWRAGEGAPAFALLTAEPGPDVAPYHDRGVIPLEPKDWVDWLFDRRPAADLLAAPPAGTLIAERKPR